MNSLFKVTLQGISPDLVFANGSYDPLELGSMNPDQLYQLLQRIKSLQAPPPSRGQTDICHPTAIVEAGSMIHSFEMLGGSILYSNSNSVVSEVGAVNLVLYNQLPNSPPSLSSIDSQGNVHHSSRQWGSSHKDLRGLTPVRKPELPPTDLINTAAATINTISTPYISEMIVRSDTAKNLYVAPLLFAILAIVLGLGYFAVDEPVAGLITLIIAFGLFGLTYYFKQRVRVLFRLGFDWSQNVIWAMKEGQTGPSYSTNASCIRAFSIEKTRGSRSRFARIGNSSTPILTRVEDKYEFWDLMVEKTDGSRISLFSFYTEPDAVNVYHKANWLLSQQV